MQHAIRSIASAILCIALLTNCSNIQDDGTRTKAEGGLTGALLGAAAGAVIGNQSGRAGEGALIGALAGGLAGTAYGAHVAQKKASYASAESWLNACIAQANQANQKVASYNNSLKQQIASLEQQISVAKAAGNRSKMTAAKRQFAKIEKEAAKYQNLVKKEIQEQSGALDNAGSTPGTSNLRTSIIDLKATERSLQNNLDRIASLKNQISL